MSRQYVEILISGRELLEAFVFIACAWGKVGWKWFWILFILNEIHGLCFKHLADTEAAA